MSARRLRTENSYRGRKPSYSRHQFEAVRGLLGQAGISVGTIAKDTGLSRQTVYRIKDDPAAAEAALRSWGL